MHAIALTALLLAADRVDSTTGVQMAYLKTWAPRSFRALELVAPPLLPGAGRVVSGDIMQTARTIGPVDLAYLDPPYNQHRYEANYHVWETLVRWDHPDHYGTACKRVDIRDSPTRSPFNSRRTFPAALRELLSTVECGTLMLSYNDESWVESDELARWLGEAGFEHVRAVGFEANRYVGARIGIHNPDGLRVGTVGRTRNVEWLFIAGDRSRVEAAAAAAADHGAAPLSAAP
jgi:adenine-specific DNA-methyltransferase